MTSKESPSALRLSKEQQRWITALESKKYKQGESYLKQKNGKKLEYCCLGVACQVFKRKCHLDEQDQGDIFSFNSCSGALPESVSGLLKLDTGGGRVDDAPEGYYRSDGKTVQFLTAIPDKAYNKISDNGVFAKHGKYTYYNALCLIDYNDGGVPFEEIALILKTYPQHYFSDAEKA